MFNMKKYLLAGGLATILFLSGCVSYSDGEPVGDAESEEVEEQEVSEGEVEEKAPAEEPEKEVEEEVEEVEEKEEPVEELTPEEEIEDNPIIVDENIAFSDYSIIIKDVELEDNEAIVNMKFKNDSYTEDLSFIQSVIMSVYQGDNELEETSNEMMENAGSNNGIYYKHSTGIYSNVDLSYELIDDTTPLTIKFTPLLSEYDESQEIEIELQ